MKMRHNFGKIQRGFTLIDLVTVSALMFVFGAALFGTFHTMRNALARQDSYFDANRAARVALEWIARDVKEAVRIETVHGGSTTADDVLVLALPSIDADGQPTDIENDFDYVAYKQDPSVLTELVRELDVLDGISTRGGGADGSRVVARSIGGVGFSADGTGLSSVSDVTTVKALNVAVTGLGNAQNASQTTTLDSDVILRNNVDD